MDHGSGAVEHAVQAAGPIEVTGPDLDPQALESGRVATGTHDPDDASTAALEVGQQVRRDESEHAGDRGRCRGAWP